MNFKKHIERDIKTQLLDLSNYFGLSDKISDKEFLVASKQLATNVLFDYDGFLKQINKNMSFEDFKSFFENSQIRFTELFFSFWKKIENKIPKTISKQNVLNNFVSLFVDYETSLFQWMYEESKH